MMMTEYLFKGKLYFSFEPETVGNDDDGVPGVGSQGGRGQ